MAKVAKLLKVNIIGTVVIEDEDGQLEEAQTQPAVIPAKDLRGSVPELADFFAAELEKINAQLTAPEQTISTGELPVFESNVPEDAVKAE